MRRGPNNTVKLTDNQRLVHAILTKRGPCSAYEVMGRTGLKESGARYCLEKLRGLGAVEPVAGTPVRFRALPLVATPVPERKRRPCLGCGGGFLSAGPHNRLCPACCRVASEAPAWVA